LVGRAKIKESNRLMNIVQIGCHDGDDHVFEFISSNSKNISKAYLIEPLSENCRKARERYSNFNFVEIIEAAIVEDENISNIEIFYPENIEQSQTTSIFRNHAEKHQDKVLSKFVDCFTISKLFENKNLQTINRLYIDAEGLDCKIINSINFTKHNIGYIEYEYTHSDGTDQFGEFGKNIENKLNDLGYTIRNSPPFNKIAEKLI
jgi:FkbM family methyltransferase